MRWSLRVSALNALIATFCAVILIYVCYHMKWSNKRSVAPKHYPGIGVHDDYELLRTSRSLVMKTEGGIQASPNAVDELSLAEVEERFYELMTMLQISCRPMLRMGGPEDGGWDVCIAPPYNFAPGCLVYSFGIGYDWKFDDAMDSIFNCTVKSFDPSMKAKDHHRSSKIQFFQLGLGAENAVTEDGWKLMSLRNIIAQLGHTESLIDVLKFDIEFNEWECLRAMVVDGSLYNVKQLMLEIHTHGSGTSKQLYVKMQTLLASLEGLGFRRYHQDINANCIQKSPLTGKERSGCYELYYINIRFLQ